MRLFGQLPGENWHVKKPPMDRADVWREVVALNHYRAALAGRHMALEVSALQNARVVAGLALLAADTTQPGRASDVQTAITS